MSSVRRRNTKKKQARGWCSALEDELSGWIDRKKEILSRTHYGGIIIIRFVRYHMKDKTLCLSESLYHKKYRM